MVRFLLPAVLAGATVPGYLVAARGGGRLLAERIWRFLYWSSIPAGPVMLSAAPIGRAGPAVLVAAAALALLALPAVLYARRRFDDRRERAAFTLSVVISNSGWLGLPVVMALLGPRALPTAALYNGLVSGAVGPPLGVALATARPGESRSRRLWSAVTRNPFLAATLVGLAWALGPIPHPHVLIDVTGWWIIATAVPAFFAFGVALARAPLRLDRDVAAAVALRVVAGPLLLLALSAAVPVPRAFLVLAAMATGLSSLTVAGEHGLPLARLTPAIAWSTAIVLAATATLAALGGLPS